MRSAPVVDTKVRATTTTATAQAVVVLVSKVGSETENGWFVYGYRVNPSRGMRNRQTMYPRLYFVSKAALAAGDPR